ncbi:centrosomal protein of 128 kDa isoform X5 [Narcine bancroftii]|uniref:centrosomal protein of 128 kDa isoform X5 n=1 Tax=Narcine bancroftii TaxID=1343680 RepID=UPI0038311EED
MADTSSDSDTQHHNFPRRRGSLNTATQGRSRMQNAARVTEKLDTLASTLQDTSRDLKSVDRLLGQYRGYTNEQMEAVAKLRDNLEQSIDELRSQRLSRTAGISPFRASELQDDSMGRRYRPTSPLRDPASHGKTGLRRSRSASVRFVDDVEPFNHVHSLHQSLRDLSSDQLRLGEEVDREISRRNRTDKETRSAIDSLSERVREVSRVETVSERVERRLQEIEKEMRTERQLAEHRQDQLGQMAVQLQEELKKRDKIDEIERVKSKLSKSEEEKFLIEQELGSTRQRLDQSEGSREMLASQIGDLRSQLLKTEQERATLQHRILQLQQKNYREIDEDDRLIQAVTTRSELEKQLLEKQIMELRAQLNQDGTQSEMGELKRSLKRKEKEKMELSAHVEAEQADEKNFAKAQRRQVEKMKTECNKLAEELIQGEAENTKLRRKCLVLKQELETKGQMAVNGEECARQLEEMTFNLKDQITKIQTEQEMILCAIGKEIEAACDFLSRDAGDKFKAITLTPGLENDPHRWLAEMKTKLQWLCEEVKERDGRELKLRSHLRQCRGQLKELMQSKESETELFIEQITKQEHLLEEIHREKRELLQKMCRKDEEMRALQDRIADLETSTQMPLDHLQSASERLSILDSIRDLEDSQHHRDMIEERYIKYKDIVSSLQQQLKDSTRRIQAHQVEESDASLGTERMDDAPATLSDESSFPSTCHDADVSSPNGRDSKRRNQPSGSSKANRGREFSREATGRKSPAEKDMY